MVSSTPGKDLLVITSTGTSIGILAVLYLRLMGSVSVYLIWIGLIAVAVLLVLVRMIPGVAKTLALILSVLFGMLITLYAPR